MYYNIFKVTNFFFEKNYHNEDMHVIMLLKANLSLINLILNILNS